MIGQEGLVVGGERDRLFNVEIFREKLAIIQIERVRRIQIAGGQATGRIGRGQLVAGDRGRGERLHRVALLFSVGLHERFGGKVKQRCGRCRFGIQLVRLELRQLLEFLLEVHLFEHLVHRIFFLHLHILRLVTDVRFVRLLNLLFVGRLLLFAASLIGADQLLLIFGAGRKFLVARLAQLGGRRRQHELLTVELADGLLLLLVAGCCVVFVLLAVRMAW